ncbi:MAG: hypothetical protein FJ387_10170 [Verrucomicrobia bacterium]|nr:hypothetical protein [Verrucomicrobiota bacterium]
MTRTLQGWPLLQLLVVSVWFRLVALSLCLGAVAVAVLLPRVWRSTPPGFAPEVRISLLDRVQGWRLERQARHAEGAGDHRAALSCWRSAWGNDPGNADWLRHTLRAMARCDAPADLADLATEAAGWLLRLSPTNRTDVELVARTWLACGLGEQVPGLMRPLPGPHPVTLERLHLMALCEAGRMTEFAARVGTNQVLSAELQRALLSVFADQEAPDLEPEFRLACVAFLAVFGPTDLQGKALDHVRAARQQRDTARLASDLQWMIHTQQRDLPACEELLREFEETGRATVRHHTSLWLLLAASGQKTEAIRRAQGNSPVPKSGGDALRLARAQMALDLWDQAEHMLTRLADLDEFRGEVLELSAELLMQRRKWDELRQLALRLRLQPEVMLTWGGYSYYLEGLADWEMGQPDAAHVAFEQMATLGVPHPVLALKVAERLLRLGAAAWAEPVLLAHRDDGWSDPSYLTALLHCAQALKNSAYLGPVTARLRALRPDDPQALRHHTRTLVILRRDADAAVSQSFELLRRFPQDPEVALTHVGALLLNARFAEAEALLDRVAPHRLPPAELAQYRLARFELKWRRGHRLEAQAALPQIDPRELYPVQAQWLEAATRAFESGAGETR